MLKLWASSVLESVSRGAGHAVGQPGGQPDSPPASRSQSSWQVGGNAEPGSRPRPIWGLGPTPDTFSLSCTFTPFIF